MFITIARVIVSRTNDLQPFYSGLK